MGYREYLAAVPRSRSTVGSDPFWLIAAAVCDLDPLYRRTPRHSPWLFRVALYRQVLRIPLEVEFRLLASRCSCRRRC